MSVLTLNGWESAQGFFNKAAVCVNKGVSFLLSNNEVIITRDALETGIKTVILKLDDELVSIGGRIIKVEVKLLRKNHDDLHDKLVIDNCIGVK